MIIRLVSAALVAGFLAAVVATGLQLVLTSPLILEAEKYEAGIAEPQAMREAIVWRAHAHSHDEAKPAEPEGWQPAPGLERMAYTGLATLVGGVGYALLLGATMLVLRREPNPESGLALGIAGFLSVALAPAVGLPPELPGMGAAALELRQLWWLATALATAAGLYLIAERRTAPAIAAGLVLIVAPHVAGAPLAAETASQLPAAFAAQFAARSLAIGFVFWAVIGLSYGWAWNLFGREGARG